MNTPSERRLFWPAVSVMLPFLFVAAAVLCGCLQEKPAHAAEGFATFYTSKSCAGEAKSMKLKGSYWGRYTANGERYDEKAFTCAIRAPLKYGKSGKTYFVYGKDKEHGVFVRHNDMGPCKKSVERGVIVDLTPAAFQEVCGDLKRGRCLVNMQEVI